MNVPTIMEDVNILVIIQLVVTTVHVILAISLTLTTIIVMVRLLTLLVPIWLYIINYKMWMNVVLVLMDVIRIVSTQKAPIFVLALLDTIL